MMIKPTTKLSESLSRKQLMQLELLIASVVPAAAILVVAVAGTAVNFNTFFFLLDVLTCAIAIFFSERSIILRMQREMDEQLTDLITACHEFIKGNKEMRVSMPGDDQLALLGSTLNSLFDHVQTTPSPSKENASADEAQTRHPDPTNDEADMINEQLEQLYDDISPALDGDLRVQSPIVEETANDSVANVADLCNALVETLVQFTKWTLSGSGRILKISRKVLDRSSALAQATEAQMIHLSQTTTTIENLVAFIQRMGSALQLSADMAQEAYAYLQENDAEASYRESDELLEQLTSNIQRQIQLLEEVLESTHSTTTTAESAIGDLYTFAQQFYQSSTNFIKTAENIKSIATIAESWFNSVNELALPEEEE